VEYYKDGVKHTAFARREIVVALSAIFTPQLLQLSGIGPAKHLQSLGIHVWVNNPNVGQNLQNNHLSQGANYYPNATYGSALQAAFAANQYAFNGTGPWAATGAYMYAYGCANNVTYNCTDPDIMIGVQTGGFFTTANEPTYQTIATQVSNVKPLLKASVNINSSDPFALVNMTVDLFYYRSQLDIQIFGWKWLRQVLRTPPTSYVIGAEITPGPQYQNDTALTQWILANTKTAHHWTGTSKFGNAGDPKRVVDPQLRVVGVKNLRVGDGSIFPDVNSHLQASACVAGERVANFILRDSLSNN